MTSLLERNLIKQNNEALLRSKYADEVEDNLDKTRNQIFGLTTDSESRVKVAEIPQIITEAKPVKSNKKRMEDYFIPEAKPVKIVIDENGNEVIMTGKSGRPRHTKNKPIPSVSIPKNIPFSSVPESEVVRGHGLTHSIPISPSDADIRRLSRKKSNKEEKDYLYNLELSRMGLPNNLPKRRNAVLPRKSISRSKIYTTEDLY